MADYPSISFSTKVKLPVPQALPWRNRIGVVGEFSRGPTNPTIVDPREFTTLFGIDGSNGSVAVQQAMEMGAADFVISRAVPADSPAETSIQFSSFNPLNVPPVVATELQTATSLNPVVDAANYTVGLEFGVNYIGSPLVARTIFETVSTDVRKINHPNFTSDQANLRIHAVDFKQGGTSVQQAVATSVLTADVTAAVAGSKQIIKLADTDSVGHDYTAENLNLVPGYMLDNGVEQFLILTRPFALNTGYVGVMVENLADNAVTGVVTGLQIKDPPEDRYIFGYNLVLSSGRGLSPIDPSHVYFSKQNEVYNDSFIINPIQSYFSLKASEGGIYHEFKYDTTPTATINDKVLLGSENFGSGADEGIYLLFGVLDNQAPMRVALKGQITIPFAVSSVMVGSDSAGTALAFTPGTSFATIVKDLQAVIYSDLVVSSLINEAETVTNTFPYSLNLMTALVGSEANRVFYRLNRYVSVPGSPEEAKDVQIKVLEPIFGMTEFDTDILFNNAFSGPRGAFREYYSLDGTPILRINAVSPGVQNIVVSLVPDELSSADNPALTVTVVNTANGVSTTEVGQFRMDSINTITGEFENTGLESIVGYFIPLVEPAGGTVSPALYTLLPLRVAPPLGLLSTNYAVGPTAVSASGVTAISGLPLLGGTNFRAADGSSIVEARTIAYKNAVRRLASADIAFLVIAGLPYGTSAYADVFRAAIDQASYASAESGLRQVFFETPFNMSPKQSAILSNSVRSSLVTLVNGHITMALRDGTFASRVGVTGYYAGVLATRPPHIAPHANYGGQFMQGVLNSTSQSDPDSKNVYSRGRVESLHFDRGLNRWKFLNGLTTSTDNTQKYVSVVRLRLQIMSDLQNYLQWVLSEPNTRALQRKVETSVEAYMNSRLQEGWLLRLGPVVCNETNNTETDMVNGKLYVEISYVPIVPADFIFVSITEDYTLLDTLQFTTQPAFNA